MANLIFCFDGTCNNPEDSTDYFEDSSISNVLKLHAFFGGKLDPHNGVNADLPNQRSFYYSGVGTRGNWLKKKFNALFSPPYGDMDDIIDEATEDLNNTHKAGDQIYIFGFSRGAAIARMFASTIKDKSVRFLGVFDTVAATRGSLDLNPDSFPASEIVFEDGTIGDHIEEAFHLLSIDDKRILFQPTLFNKDDRVTEVWFAGVHSDIGGGYWFDGLSDVALQFMIDNLPDELQVLDISNIDYDDLKIKGAQDAIGIDDLNINPLTNGKIHSQILSKANSKLLSPRVVRVNVDDNISKHIPIVHYTVAKRFAEVAEYRPYALRNTKYQIMDENGNLSDVKNGIADL